MSIKSTEIDMATTLLAIAVIVGYIGMHYSNDMKPYPYMLTGIEESIKQSIKQPINHDQIKSKVIFKSNDNNDDDIQINIEI